MEIFDQLITPFINQIEKGLETYGELFFGVVTGGLFVSIYHRFIGTRILRQSYEQTINHKDEIILAYKQLLVERLDKIKVDREDLNIIKKLKKFFRVTSLK